MPKTITQPKIKLLIGKTPEEILKVWKKTQGIWQEKKPEPIVYLKKMRKEWKRKIS